jgi:hypothetical protein
MRHIAALLLAGHSGELQPKEGEEGYAVHVLHGCGAQI